MYDVGCGDIATFRAFLCQTYSKKPVSKEYNRYKMMRFDKITFLLTLLTPNRIQFLIISKNVIST